MYQQLTLVGNLGNEPEMRYTPDGTPVTSFSLAVSRSWVKDGSKLERTIWFRVTAWRKLAETAAEYLKKGRQVLVVGEVEEARPWTDKDGNNRASLEVTASTIRFLSGSGGSAQHDTQGATGDAQQGAGDEDVPW